MRTKNVTWRIFRWIGEAGLIFGLAGSLMDHRWRDASVFFGFLLASWIVNWQGDLILELRESQPEVRPDCDKCSATSPEGFPCQSPQGHADE